MAYRITKDHIEKGDREGVCGPRDISCADEQRLKDQKDCKHFKMYDDDGELYYEGYWFGHNDESDEFEALDCFGTPNAGCTYLKMKDKSGKYKIV